MKCSSKTEEIKILIITARKKIEEKYKQIYNFNNKKYYIGYQLDPFKFKLIKVFFFFITLKMNLLFSFLLFIFLLIFLLLLLLFVNRKYNLLRFFRVFK